MKEFGGVLVEVEEEELRGSAEDDEEDEEELRGSAEDDEEDEEEV